MIGTWTPPGAIFTVQFDDEKLELKLIKRTEIPKDEPISWMTFDVSCPLNCRPISSSKGSIEFLADHADKTSSNSTRK
jgi:hypothetical protein